MLEISSLQRGVKIAPYTTYKIGGAADFFVVVKNSKELVGAIIEARRNNTPYFILGAGANILFGDKGFRGLVIKNEANNIHIKNHFITAESGTTIAELINLAVNNNLSGLEHFTGIPSTVGGALWQNLHFLSPDRLSTIYIDSVVDSAEILDESNNLQKVKREFFEFGYDTSILHKRNLLVVAVTFKLKPGDKSLIRRQAEENLKWRSEKQPPLEKFPSSGSVFKKIEGVGAGRLIDDVGLKGYKLGGAQVSEKHANFIVNTGDATAQDILGVIDFVQKKVFDETGYKLETEIGLVGEF